MFWERFKDVGVSGFLDIAFMALLIYTLLVWFKSRRAGFVLTGILIFAGIYILTRQFNLTMTSAVFEQFFTVLFIALVVIFQEELRYFFEQVAVWSLNRRLKRRRKRSITRNEVDILVRTLGDLAKDRVGVLLVLRGKQLILRHLEGGVDLNGEMSEPLLKSIFDPHSIGHDGAVIVEGNRVAKFGCHLPLSKNLKKIEKGGTRHAAALGLSEFADALCLVVSEERGTISVARNGDIEVVGDLEQLARILERFYEEVNPEGGAKPWYEFLKQNSGEKFAALVLAVALWFVVVEGSKVNYRAYDIPITYNQLPKPWYVDQLNPRNVEATFRGPNRAFYFLRSQDIRLHVDLKLQEGLQTVKIFPYNLVFPKPLVLEQIEPREALALLYMEKEKEKGKEKEKEQEKPKAEKPIEKPSEVEKSSPPPAS